MRISCSAGVWVGCAVARRTRATARRQASRQKRIPALTLPDLVLASVADQPRPCDAPAAHGFGSPLNSLVDSRSAPEPLLGPSRLSSVLLNDLDEPDDIRVELQEFLGWNP